MSAALALLETGEAILEALRPPVQEERLAALLTLRDRQIAELGDVTSQVAARLQRQDEELSEALSTLMGQVRTQMRFNRPAAPGRGYGLVDACR